MHRNVAAAQRRDRIEVNAAGVVAAVTQENNRADGQIGRLRRQLLEAVADMRRGTRGVCEGVQVGDSVGVSIEAIDASLEFVLELAQHAALQSLHSLGLACRAVFRNIHTARVVDNHCDDVLLRLQLGDHDGRLPEQHQNQ